MESFGEAARREDYKCEGTQIPRRLAEEVAWLSKIESGMQCKLFLKHKKQNAFTSPSGCKNYRTNTLERHVELAEHRHAVQAEAMQKEFVQASATAQEKNLTGADAGILAAMRTVHWMAVEDLQKLQGCEAIADLAVGGNATYLTRSSGQEFQSTVAKEIRSRVVQDIREANLYSVLIDESTGISISKHMVIYVRIVDPEFVPRTYFLKNVTVDNPKADAITLFTCLKETLEEENLDITKVYGFGSDGASVMVGRKRSVSSLLKEQNPHCVNIHCLAHRLNLASSQASRNIPFKKEVEKTLSELYKYFGGSKSGNRKCSLEQIQKVLGDPCLKIKECYEIRWLAYCESRVLELVFLVHLLH